MTDTTTRDEAAIRDVLGDRAMTPADAERLFAAYAGDAVRYTLAPPLRQQPGTEYGDAAGIRRWLEGFAGPVQVAHRDLDVHVDGTVAYAHALTHMTATPAGAAEPFRLWYRSTYGLRRVHGTWRIAHEHQSTPFHMDGSFAAAVELTP